MEDEELKKYFGYLNNLRDSEVENKLGSIKNLMNKFKLDRETATSIWLKWAGKS